MKIEIHIEKHTGPGQFRAVTEDGEYITVENAFEFEKKWLQKEKEQKILQKLNAWNWNCSPFGVANAIRREIKEGTSPLMVYEWLTEIERFFGYYTRNQVEYYLK